MNKFKSDFVKKTPFISDPSYYYATVYTCILKWSLLFKFSDWNFVRISYISDAIYQAS